MHTESAYDGCTVYCYPEQGMVDRLLRVHIQSQRAFGPWWTLSYNRFPPLCHSVEYDRSIPWIRCCSSSHYSMCLNVFTQPARMLLLFCT